MSVAWWAQAIFDFSLYLLIQRAAKFLDSSAVTAGRFLWRRPLARLIAVLYLVCSSPVSSACHTLQLIHLNKVNVRLLVGIKQANTPSGGLHGHLASHSGFNSPLCLLDITQHSQPHYTRVYCVNCPPFGYLVVKPWGQLGNCADPVIAVCKQPLLKGGRQQPFMVKSHLVKDQLANEVSFFFRLLIILIKVSLQRKIKTPLESIAFISCLKGHMSTCYQAGNRDKENKSWCGAIYVSFDITVLAAQVFIHIFLMYVLHRLQVQTHICLSNSIRALSGLHMSLECKDDD